MSLYGFYFNSYTDFRRKSRLNPLNKIFLFSDLVEKNGLRHLDENSQFVNCGFPVENYLIMRLRAFNLEQHGFNLRGENGNPPYLDHVISPAHDLVHPDKSPSAGAGFGDEARQVPRPEPDNRKRFFRKCRNNQFTCFAVRQRGEGFRINDLNKKVVFVDVKTLSLRTLPCYTRTHYFA